MDYNPTELWTHLWPVENGARRWAPSPVDSKDPMEPITPLKRGKITPVIPIYFRPFIRVI